ncbi:IS110 family transposase, partial [Hahella sp. CCB-MM4]|uniref:IS110 family transposase n=1 Tax=Hahella sp. (strain CCB-MM4) TaxID=1926491 RepID=UPI0011403319
VDQQSVLLLHRERDGLTKERTALINRFRATLAEFGIVVPVGAHKLKHWMATDYSMVESELSPIMQRHIRRMQGRLRDLEKFILELDQELNSYSKNTEACQRLEAVPGIGRLTATAIVASIGNGKCFMNARQFSAWLGLVPKQHSSGGKTCLLGISKRGDAYLRRMFIHGARAVLRHMNPKRLVTNWLSDLSVRRHRNVVIVALANKLARIAWAMLYHHRSYDEHYQVV